MKEALATPYKGRPKSSGRMLGSLVANEQTIYILIPLVFDTNCSGFDQVRHQALSAWYLKD